jgi:hypothetical protein
MDFLHEVENYATASINFLARTGDLLLQVQGNERAAVLMAGPGDRGFAQKPLVADPLALELSLAQIAAHLLFGAMEALRSLGNREHAFG